MNIFSKQNQKRGFITLTSSIIIMAVLVFIIRGISLQAIDDAEIGSAAEQYVRAKYLAEACAEYALMELANDDTYSTSTATITDGLGDDDCEVVSITGGGGSDTVLQVQSIVGGNEYNYLAEITMSTTTATTTPSIVIDSWEEVDSF